MVDFNTSLYTDIQGLGSIKKSIKENPELAKKEVAKQFEALMLQMLLKSMREGTRSLTEDNEDSEHREVYEDLFDNQLSLSLSENGLGMAELIEQSIDKAQGIQNNSGFNQNLQHELATQKAQLEDTTKQSKMDDSKKGFVDSIFSMAKKAASVIGADPKILIAQAALETSWGQKIISSVTGKSSNNLFNIKADKVWNQDSVTAKTTEFFDKQKIGTQDKFRSYQSIEDSFKDYVSFLKNNPRYQEALQFASDAETFISKLQEAGYATDPNYAKNILKIYKTLV